MMVTRIQNQMKNIRRDNILNACTCKSGCMAESFVGAHGGLHRHDGGINYISLKSHIHVITLVHAGRHHVNVATLTSRVISARGHSMEGRLTQLRQVLM